MCGPYQAENPPPTQHFVTHIFNYTLDSIPPGVLFVVHMGDSEPCRSESHTLFLLPRH